MNVRWRIVVVILVMGGLASGCSSTSVEVTTPPSAAPTSDFALLDEQQPDEADESEPEIEAETAQADDGSNAAASEPTDVPSPTAVATPTPQVPEGAIEVFEPIVIATYPHDNTAYTQGLEILDGRLIESTGRAGHPGGDIVYESDLRVVDVETGDIELRVDAPGSVFAEGLTRVDDRLVQITWKDGLVFWYDASTFELLSQGEYGGDGWGLCYDGQRLIMTDGSARLFFRDPVSFDLLGEVDVTLSGEPLAALNELECLDGRVWANVYRTDYVVRVDPETGEVDGVVDASALEQPRVLPTEVLNGIAWDPESETWLMTGKFWSTMYRVEFERTGLSTGPFDPTE